MGALTSRQHAGVEEVDIVSNHAYKYPPRSGNYFGSHFIMGGERFDTPQPEAYLFGENADLNFLGSRPTPFPYPPPQANEPTKTLKSLVNIRKESLRFVRAPDTSNKNTDGEIETAKSTLFNIEFTFDSDARCAITIYYFCTEDFTPNGVIYSPRDPDMNSETYHYKRGANQQFCQVSHIFDPSHYMDEDLSYNPDRDILPIVIHCVAEEGPEDLTQQDVADQLYATQDSVSKLWNKSRETDLTQQDVADQLYATQDSVSKLWDKSRETEPRQSHTTIAVVDHHSDGTYVLKALKQKLFVDGLCYLLQEIYGIENKNVDNSKVTFREMYLCPSCEQYLNITNKSYYNSQNLEKNLKTAGDDETEDNGAECVICMCDVRDTLILPCRHLCLCNSCADSLRYQANNCPICRAPFRALLQIRALQKSANFPQPATLPPEGSCENIPAGYEAVSLLEALNGPCPSRIVPVAPPLDVAETPDQEVAVQAAEVLNRGSIERSSSLKQASSPEDCEVSRSPRDRGSGGSVATPEVGKGETFRMSVLLAREEESQKELTKSPLLVRQCSRPQSRDKSALRPRDTVRLVNEKVSHDQDETVDDDSEAEKLSPLLDAATNTNPVPLDSVVVNDLGDDDDDTNEEDDLELTVEVIAIEEKTDIAEGSGNNPNQSTEVDASMVAAAGAGDDSDYYTPEDPATTILSPLHTDKERTIASSAPTSNPPSVESTPGRWIGMREGLMVSMPGTPLSTTSHISNRSSGDSYSSSSSTRQLLAAASSHQNSSDNQEKTLQL